VPRNAHPAEEVSGRRKIAQIEGMIAEFERFGRACG
jgi:hypothetical protein